MRKTTELFNKLSKLLNEADEPDATDITEQPPIETEGLNNFPVGLLIKAFIHVPDDSENRIARELLDQIGTMDAKDIAGQIENFLEIGVEDTKAALDDIQI